MKKLLLVCALLNTLVLKAQFEPQVGLAGNHAIHKTNTAFLGWASGGTLTRGWQQIDDTSLGYANVGRIENAWGAAGASGIVSLGDGGIATLTFENPIANGEGIDFAIFENGFAGNTAASAFLELAFVEVSSNGIDFVRFPATSNTPTTSQMGTFDYLIASSINNLAGKYIGGYGTPFDLNELKDCTAVNINAISHVKIRDVIGSIDPKYASKDAQGNFINDPFPTGFGAGGFDLDAVGVLHYSLAQGIAVDTDLSQYVFPNPCVAGNDLHFTLKNIEKISLENLQGISILNDFNGDSFHTSAINPGVYILKMSTSHAIFTQKISIQ
ncbi:MAG: hypothetical protein RL711_1403 [Bacteroidota bacterium]|jgi:hypothetical protein